MDLSFKALFWNSSLLVRLNQKQNVNFAISKFHKDKKSPKSCIISTINHFQLRHKKNIEYEEKKRVVFAFCFVIVLKTNPQRSDSSTGFSRRFSCFQYSPGALQILTGKSCLCAHSPFRFFTLTYAFDLCKFLTFLPTETVIKTIFKIFFCLIQLSRCLHLKSNSGYLISHPSGHRQLLKNVFSSLPPAWLSGVLN